MYVVGIILNGADTQADILTQGLTALLALVYLQNMYSRVTITSLLIDI
jgi:hypothetical protein